MESGNMHSRCNTLVKYGMRPHLHQCPLFLSSSSSSTTILGRLMGDGIRMTSSSCARSISVSILLTARDLLPQYPNRSLGSSASPGSHLWSGMDLTLPTSRSGRPWNMSRSSSLSALKYFSAEN